MPLKVTDDEIRAAIQKTGSKVAAARMLGINTTYIYRRCNEWNHPKPCDPYYCQSCEAMVSVYPCPACTARSALRNKIPKANPDQQSISESQTPHRSTRRSVADEEMAVPEVVLKWIHTAIAKTIPRSGNAEQTEEAIEMMAGRLRRLVEAAGRSVAEMRQMRRKV